MSLSGNTSMPIKDPSLGTSTKNPSITKNFNKPSTDDQQPSSSTSGPSVGETDPPAPPSATETQRCEAYISLNSKIKDQCKKYLIFHPNQQFGAFPDMYEPHYTYPDEKQPSKTTSHFFRGGIITTMAVFEAFIVELLEEAKKKIPKPQQNEPKDDRTQGKKQQPKKDKKKSQEEEWQKVPNKAIFHVWKKAYEEFLQKSPDQNSEVIEASSDVPTLNLTDHLLHYPMKYHYVIQDEKVATLEIGLKERKESDGLDQRRQRRLRELFNINSVDESSICAILRLFYGIRCVMAHGISDKTLKTAGGALEDFPHCKKCHGKETQAVLEASKDLEEYYNKILKDAKNESKSKKEGVENKIRRIPCKENFESLKGEMGMEQSLTAEEWEDCFKILNQFFSKPKEEKMAAPFAFFHMCRVDRWLRDQKINMYITYRMLVRINQFIHTLALQLTLAVANILMNVHKVSNWFWAIEAEDYLDLATLSKIKPTDGGKDLIQIKNDDEYIKTIINAFEARQIEMVERTNEFKEPAFVSSDFDEKCSKFLESAIEEATKISLDKSTWAKVVSNEKDDIKAYLVIVKKTSECPQTATSTTTTTTIDD